MINDVGPSEHNSSFYTNNQQSWPSEGFGYHIDMRCNDLSQFASDYYNLRKTTNITKRCSPYYEMCGLDLLQNAAAYIT